MKRPCRRDFRTRLELQTLQGSTAADSRGHSQQAFAPVTTVYGAVRQLRGEEAILARQIDARATLEVEVDYDSRINERGRLLVEGSTAEILEVMAVDNVEHRNRTMRLTCGEQR
jgi:SPP1 family predicted phage head-tail adaptor